MNPDGYRSSVETDNSKRATHNGHSVTDHSKKNGASETSVPPKSSHNGHHQHNNRQISMGNGNS